MVNRKMLCILSLLGFISIGYLDSTPKVIKRGVWMGEEIEYIDGEIIVALQEETPDEVFNQMELEYGDVKFLAIPLCGFVWIRISSGNANIFNTIQKLNKNKFIEYAGPNVVGSLHDIYYPNDPYYEDGHQWALKNTGQDPPAGTPDADIDAEEAWRVEKGDTNVIIVILDSGIPLDDEGNLIHPEFSNPDRVILGPNFVNGDTNGNFVKDYSGHGTHVAGIASAKTDNDTGIAGVSGNSKLLIIKITDDYSVWNVASAINYAVNYAIEHPDKRVVINMSGGFGYPDPLLECAVRYADENDIPFVSDVGNIHSSFPGLYAFNGFTRDHPLGYPNVIAVGASDPWDQKAWYSAGFGTVLAPGGYDGGEMNQDPPDERDIFSTFPNYPTELNPDGTGYGYLAGVSMAVPYVTGVSALMLSANPSLSDSLVRDIIAQTADDQGDRECDGYPPEKCGRLNAYKAVLASIGTPVFVGFKDYEVHTGEYLEFEVRAYDINNIESELNYSIIGELPDGAEFKRFWPVIRRPISSGSGGALNNGDPSPDIPYYTFRWTPTMAQVGEHPVVFRVEDPQENYYEDTIDIRVLPPDNGGTFLDTKSGSNRSILNVHQDFKAKKTKFNLEVRNGGFVTLKIYDVSGRKINSLIERKLTPGIYTFSWDGRDDKAKLVNSGVYFYLLKIDNFKTTGKILRVK